jgi:hypothetical protein
MVLFPAQDALDKPRSTASALSIPPGDRSRRVVCGRGAGAAMVQMASVAGDRVSRSISSAASAVAELCGGGERLKAVSVMAVGREASFANQASGCGAVQNSTQ